MLLGRVGKDPEQVPNGPVTLSLATHEIWRDANGDKKEDLQWHRIVIWGKQGENVMKYVKKGDLPYIEGKIQTDNYEKDGQKIYMTKIVAREIKFLTPKSQGDEKSYNPQQNQNQKSANDEDIPF